MYKLYEGNVKESKSDDFFVIFLNMFIEFVLLFIQFNPPTTKKSCELKLAIVIKQNFTIFLCY